MLALFFCSRLFSLPFLWQIEIMKLLVYSLLILGGLSSWSAEARRFGKIDIEGPLKKELNSVLKAAIDLHTACISQDDSQIKASLVSVISSIDSAHDHTEMADDEKMLLEKMLDSAKTQLEMTKMNRGEEKQEALKEAFNQLVQIAQVFKLDDYPVFFCSKDRSVWLQKGWKAKNPVNPDKYADCGKRVR